MKLISRFSLGMGDRFAHEGEAQLAAVIEGKKRGIDVAPVWNKSFREHTIVGSKPDDLRFEADAAVATLEWSGPYFVDADHIGLKTVDSFLVASDFFTIDVADFSGKPASPESIDAFVEKRKNWPSKLIIPGVSSPIEITESVLRKVAGKFLLAVQEAGAIYRKIAEAKGEGTFIAEVSMDETDTPQTPSELLLILSMIAGEGIPAQTVAPKFTGRFNKGVDYVGDLAQFEKEFDEDLAVVAYAIREFGLPPSLKLSVHSGSDKFSLYPIINRLVKKHGAGLHVKTAGTTWLEEVIGLAESGGDALQLAREIYIAALPYFDALVKPYAPVVDIDLARLPSADAVAGWTSEQYVAALRHDQSNPDYNPHFRQFIHVSFKVAAKLGTRYTAALKANRKIIAQNVTQNLLERHLLPIFG